MPSPALNIYFKFYSEVWLNFGLKFSHQTEATVLVYKKLNCELAGLDYGAHRSPAGLCTWTKRMLSVAFFQGKTLQMFTFWICFASFRCVNSNRDTLTRKHRISLSSWGGRLSNRWPSDCLIGPWQFHMVKASPWKVKKKKKNQPNLKL